MNRCSISSQVVDNGDIENIAPTGLNPRTWVCVIEYLAVGFGNSVECEGRVADDKSVLQLVRQDT